MLRRTASSNNLLFRAAPKPPTPGSLLGSSSPASASLLFPCAPPILSASLMRCCSTTSSSACSSTTTSPISVACPPLPLASATAAAAATAINLSSPRGFTSTTTKSSAATFTADRSKQQQQQQQQQQQVKESTATTATTAPSFALCCETIAEVEAAADAAEKAAAVAAGKSAATATATSETLAFKNNHNLHERAAVVARSLNIKDARLVAPAIVATAGDGAQSSTASHVVATSHIFLLQTTPIASASADSTTATASNTGVIDAISIFDTNTNRVVLTIDCTAQLRASENLKFKLTTQFAALCGNDMLAIILPACGADPVCAAAVTEVCGMLCDRGFNAVAGPSVDDMVDVLLQHEDVAEAQAKELALQKQKDAERKRLFGADDEQQQQQEQTFATTPAVRDAVDVVKSSATATSAAPVAPPPVVLTAEELRLQRKKICADTAGVDFSEIEATNNNKNNNNASSSSSFSSSDDAAAAAAAAFARAAQLREFALRTSFNYLRFAGAHRKIIFKSEQPATGPAFIELLHDLIVPTANVLVVDCKQQTVGGKDVYSLNTYNVRTGQKASSLGSPEAAMRLIAPPGEDGITVVVPTTRNNRELIHTFAQAIARTRRHIAFAYPRDFNLAFGTVSTSDPDLFVKTVLGIGRAKVSPSYSLEDFEREALKLGGVRFRAHVRKQTLAKAAEDGHVVDTGVANDEQQDAATSAVSAPTEQQTTAGAGAAAAASSSSVPAASSRTSGNHDNSKVDFETLNAVRALSGRISQQINMVYHNKQRNAQMQQAAAAIADSFICMVWRAHAEKAFRRPHNATAPQSFVEKIAFIDHSGKHFLPPLCSYTQRGQAVVPNLDGYSTLVMHGAKEALLLLAGDAELNRFLRRGGRVWCTAVAEYALTGFRAEYPKVALHDICLRYGAPTTVTDYSWSVSPQGMTMETELSATEEATRMGCSSSSSSLSASAADDADGDEAQSSDSEKQQQGGASTKTSSSSSPTPSQATTAAISPPLVTVSLPTSRADRSRALECAQGLRTVFSKQLQRSLKQAQLTSVLMRMEAAVVHAELERAGIHVDVKRAMQQTALARQELAQANQALSSSVPAELPVDAVSRNLFSWDNWKHVEAFFFGGTIKLGQQRLVATPGSVASFMCQLAFDCNKMKQLRDTAIVESFARSLRQQRRQGEEGRDATLSSSPQDECAQKRSSSSSSNIRSVPPPSTTVDTNRAFLDVKNWMFEQRAAAQFLRDQQQQQQQEGMEAAAAAASAKSRSSTKTRALSSPAAPLSSSSSVSKRSGFADKHGEEASVATIFTSGGFSALRDNYRLVLFDVESTGLDGETDRIVEYCFYEPATGTTLQSLVNPLRKIPISAQRVHKIDDEMVKDAPTFNAQARKIAQFLGLEMAQETLGGSAAAAAASSSSSSASKKKREQQQQQLTSDQFNSNKRKKIILMSHSSATLDHPILLNHLAAAGVVVDHSRLLIADSLPLLVCVKDKLGFPNLKLGGLAAHLGVTPSNDGSAAAAATSAAKSSSPVSSSNNNSKNNKNKSGSNIRTSSSSSKKKRVDEEDDDDVLDVEAAAAASAASSSSLVSGDLHRADADVKLLWNVLKAALGIRTPIEILPLIVDTFTVGDRHCFHGHCTEMRSVATVELPGVVHRYFPGRPPKAVERMKALTIASSAVLKEFVDAGCNEATLYAQKLKLERNITVFDRDDGTLGTIHGDSKIRQEISLCGTATGRTASKNPNCQNIPKDDKSAIREVFVSRHGPESGWMVEVDFKQLEIAVLGLLSQDPAMVKDLDEGVDFHLRRCQVMVKRSYEELVALHKSGDKTVKEHRQRAKTVSFQRMYGAGPSAIQKYTKLDMEIVKGMIEQEEMSYPGVRAMHQITRSMCLRQGNPGTTTHFIYELPTGARVSLEARDVTQSLPAVKNYPIQSYGAELMTIALAKLLREFVLNEKYIGKACLVNFVHDSVWLDCHDSVVKEVVHLVSGVMSSLQDQLAKDFPGAPNNVKFGVSASIGRNLYDTMSLQQWESAEQEKEKLQQQKKIKQQQQQQQLQQQQSSSSPASIPLGAVSTPTKSAQKRSESSPSPSASAAAVTRSKGAGANNNNNNDKMTPAAAAAAMSAALSAVGKPLSAGKNKESSSLTDSPAGKSKIEHE